MRCRTENVKRNLHSRRVFFQKSLAYGVLGAGPTLVAMRTRQGGSGCRREIPVILSLRSRVTAGMTLGRSEGDNSPKARVLANEVWHNRAGLLGLERSERPFLPI